MFGASPEKLRFRKDKCEVFFPNVNAIEYIFVLYPNLWDNVKLYGLVDL